MADADARRAAKKAGKRPAGSGSGSAPAAAHPWPRDPKPFDIPPGVLNTPLKDIVKSQAYLNRSLLPEWDTYDSLFYNGLLGVVMEPTRFLCPKTLQLLGIKDQVKTLLRQIGLGNIATKYHPLYPDLARQFIASCRIEYVDPYHKTASSGSLLFKANGIQYRLTFREICEVFQFEPDNEGVTLPANIHNMATFWRDIGYSYYSSNASLHVDIKHPVLRLIIKVIGYTILCTMEATKVRLKELVLLHSAIGVHWPATIRDDSDRTIVNLGAIFASHLVSLKNKGAEGHGRKESVGSLLTPLMKKAGVDFGPYEVVRTQRLMDAEFLATIKYLKLSRYEPRFKYQLFRQPLTREVPLPSPYTTIDTREALTFTLPDADPVPDPPRASSSSSRASTRLGPFPEPPESIYADDQSPAFKRWMVSTLASMWNHMRCQGNSDAIPPPPPPSPPRFARSDSDDEDDTRGGRAPRTRSSSPSHHV